jgi:hypothetical protein
MAALRERNDAEIQEMEESDKFLKVRMCNPMGECWVRALAWD